MAKKIAIMIIALILVQAALASEQFVFGTVSSDGSAITNTKVTITNPSNKNTNFTFTDSKGNYKLIIEGEKGDLVMVEAQQVSTLAKIEDGLNVNIKVPKNKITGLALYNSEIEIPGHYISLASGLFFILILGVFAIKVAEIKRGK